MPPSRFACRCLVFLLLVAAGAGFLAPPAEAAKRPFGDIVDAAARRHGVDADLVHAVIAVESGYRASAQSPAGAQGLMQLMPGTQRDLGVSDAFDPRQNVDAGVAYLRRLTDEFGTVLALAAYNAGPGAVRRYNGIPPYEETHAYVQAVLGRDRPAADAQAAEAHITGRRHQPRRRDRPAADEQAAEEHAPSGYRALAVSEADLAESARGEPRLQDDHLAADGTAGLEPQALDKEAEREPAADTVRLVLHGGAVGADANRDGPDLPVLAATQVSDLDAQRGSNRRRYSVNGRRVPTSRSGQRAPVSSSPTADRGADPLRLGPATLVSAGLPRGRPGTRSPVAASSRLTMRTRASTTNPGALSGALDGSNTWPTWRPAVLAVPLAATSPRSAAARSLAGTPDGRS